MFPRELWQSNNASAVQRTHLEEVNAMLVELKIKLKARQRSDGRFEIRPTVGGKRVSIYGETAEELARKYKEKLKNTSIKQEHTTGAKLFEWLDEWCEIYKKPNIKPRSYLNIIRTIKKHIKPNLQNKPLSRYSTSELMIALNAIESTRMRKYARGIIRESFSRAVADGKIKASPAQNLPAVKHIVQKGQAIPLIELQELIIKARENLPYNAWLYYLFCLFAGTRREEAVLTKFEDCDFQNRIILIRGTKTEGSFRRIPMFPILEKILTAAKKDGNGKGRIFKLSIEKAEIYFRKFRGENSKAVLHWLRHTFGTIHICALHVPLNTVSLWLGHSDASTTIDNYTHPENLAPDIYYSGLYSEEEKIKFLKERYNNIISTVEKLL